MTTDVQPIPRSANSASNVPGEKNRIKPVQTNRETVNRTREAR